MRQLSSAITHDFQQVTVGVEKIEAIVIAPVDIFGAFDASCGQALTRRFEVGAADPKRMMALAQWMFDTVPPIADAERLAMDLEERQVLIAALQQRLMTEMGNDFQPQHFGVEALGAREVCNLDPKMVQPLEFHRFSRAPGIPLTYLPRPVVIHKATNTYR
jgi:hypothetical protein